MLRGLYAYQSIFADGVMISKLGMDSAHFIDRTLEIRHENGEHFAPKCESQRIEGRASRRV